MVSQTIIAGMVNELRHQEHLAKAERHHALFRDTSPLPGRTFGLPRLAVTLRRSALAVVPRFARPKLAAS